MDNLGGRPSLYESSKDLEEKIEEYFEYVKGEFHLETDYDEDGKPVEVKKWDRYPEPITITGLCLYLGFESRQSFYDYEKRDGFSYIIKRARLRVENYYEKTGASADKPTFQIFALKNMGWADRQEVDHTTKGESIQIPQVQWNFINAKKKK